ncbi:MAG: prolipoprotein diacylglyceryl transferase [Planctomycetes bacterium]|nr:prolipoprotein diacylglyceryl transferase [Planctomycetota bacterium]
MRFPVTLDFGPFELSVHALLELAAYVVGFALLRREQRRHGDVIGEDARWTLNVAVIFGAVIGSKLVQWASDLDGLAQHAGEIGYWLGGKSIVGGLLGGTLAVEWAKRRHGITRRTGDALVLPLVVSIAVGRVGCFLSGLADHTYGVATSLPWGVDFGDGIARHPTQLYEIVFLGLLGMVLARRRTRAWPEGARFDVFLLAYFAFRLAIDFWKPYPRLPASIGLAATQWAALAGIVWRAAWLAHRARGVAEGVAR